MASKKSAKSTKKKAVDAITLLKDDHEKVRGLLEQLERATGTRRETLLAKVDKELQIHTTIEEEIFYPAYREAARKKDEQVMVYEAVEEHHVVKDYLPGSGDGANNEELKAKAKVLKELVEHHADEEESDMFPSARKLLGRDELRELGEQMQARKKELGG